MAIWAIVTVVCFGLAIFFTTRLEQQAESAALERADVGAQAVEATVAGLLEAVDTLHDLVKARQNLLASGDLAGAKVIERQLANMAEREWFDVLQVSIIGADGWLNWSSGPNWKPVYLGDREHFKAHIEGSVGLFISAPVIGRASGHLTVQMTRRLSDSSGRFAGVAVVSVDPHQLARHLPANQFGPGSATVIFRRDGTTITRSRDTEQAIRIHHPPNQEIMLALAQSPQGHLIVGRSAYDGLPKLTAYRSLPNAPLVVAVTLDKDAALAPIAFVRPVLSIMALIISMLTLCCMALGMLWIERQRIQIALDAARRERESAREQLVHNQRMEALGRLAGGMAHDFNNVLQTILSATAAIKTATDDPALRRIVDNLTNAAERGASVTRRLLAFSRRGALNSEPVDIPVLLSDIANVLAHTLDPTITLKIIADPKLPSILADKRQLETVLINLAINARDAMAPNDGGSLTIAAATERISPQDGRRLGLKPGDYVRLSIADSGVGMDEHVLARATEPFFTTKPQEKGTGLGLSMAKGFAEQSSGAFQLQSRLGIGTTVTLWFPVVAAGEQPAQIDELRANPPPASTPAPLQNQMRVLLVDDEATIRHLLAENLTARGWAVTTAADGGSAQKFFEAGKRFDLLITDLSMPGGDGFNLIAQARAHQPRLPALLMTGDQDDASRERLSSTEAAGPFRFLQKPVRTDDLAAHAKFLVESQRTSAS